MIQHSSENLLYRGSRDGFSASAFHSRCDGQANTITIVKNNFNYVFGGFTAAPWKSDGTYSTDQNAFIFSLRRSNVSNFYAKYPVRDSSKAIWNSQGRGPAFGSYEGSYYCDILIGYNLGNYADFGASYSLPQGYSYGSSNTRSFLAGSYSSWTVTEVEVYKLNGVQINSTSTSTSRSISTSTPTTTTPLNSSVMGIYFIFNYFDNLFFSFICFFKVDLLFLTILTCMAQKIGHLFMIELVHLSLVQHKIHA
jgi:hypothetical protein